MGHCPACHCEMESTAIVAAFNDPPGGAFWGEPGARGIVCQAAGYRLATMAPDVTAPAPRPVENALPALPLFEQRQEDWLP